MSDPTHLLNGFETRLQGAEESIRVLDNAVFGARDNPKEQPGVIVEQVRMGLEQQRTNEILTEFREDVKKAFVWLFSLMATSIAAAVFALIFKAATPDAPAAQITTTTTTTHAP